MPPADDRTVRSREQPRMFLIHIATASFAFPIVLALATLFDWSGATAFYVGAGMVASVIVWDIARCRSVTIAPDALTVAGRRVAWDEIESTRVREIPLARAGIFIRLTDAAREHHRLPPPRHRDFGFGLAAAPTPELAAERFDYFLRAHRARLELWFMLISVRQLHQMGTELRGAMSRAGLLPPTHVTAAAAASPAGVSAAVVSAHPESVTIELRADSIEDLLAGAARAIGAALPPDIRWNPAFTGGVMVLVGPLSLGDDPRADACLEHVKAAVKSQLAGTPSKLAAIFAARSG